MKWFSTALSLFIVCPMLAAHTCYDPYLNSKSSPLFDSKSQLLAKKAESLYKKGKVSEASIKFETAYHSTGDLENSYLYNAAYCAFESKNFPRAKSLLRSCLEKEYYAKGEIFVKLADIAKQENQSTLCRSYLEAGLSRFPTHQGLLIGMINYLSEMGEDHERIFDLLEEAKRNEPNNPSLYYLEGQLLYTLGQTDEAIASYDKCSIVDPTYIYGYIAKGIIYYNMAAQVQEIARDELDDQKYMHLVDRFDECLKACIDPFESAFELTNDSEVKKSISEYLVNASKRFIDDPTYKSKYEKYSKIYQR